MFQFFKFFKRSVCAHDFQVIDKMNLPSAYEQMMAARTEAYSSKTLLPEQSFKEGLPSWCFQKTVCVIVGCKKCGFIHSVSAINPPEKR